MSLCKGVYSQLECQCQIKCFLSFEELGESSSDEESVVSLEAITGLISFLDLSH